MARLDNPATALQVLGNVQVLGDVETHIDAAFTAVEDGDCRRAWKHVNRAESEGAPSGSVRALRAQLSKTCPAGVDRPAHNAPRFAGLSDSLAPLAFAAGMAGLLGFFWWKKSRETVVAGSRVQFTEGFQRASVSLRPADELVAVGVVTAVRKNGPYTAVDVKWEDGRITQDIASSNLKVV